MLELPEQTHAIRLRLCDVTIKYQLLNSDAQRYALLVTRRNRAKHCGVTLGVSASGTVLSANGAKQAIDENF